MSMARCCQCSELVDTDEEPESFLAFGDKDDRCVCHGCRQDMHVCARCGFVCDTVEDSEIEASEAWGAVEVRRVTFLVSDCCNVDVEECA
jgi:hypothetical protein